MTRGIRIQVATYGWLTADVIVEPGQTAGVIAALTLQKWYAGEAMGGVVSRRAADPRTWDVTIGDRIDPSLPVSDGICPTCQCLIADHEDAYGQWHGCRGARAIQTANAAQAAGVPA